MLRKVYLRAVETCSAFLNGKTTFDWKIWPDSTENATSARTSLHGKKGKTWEEKLYEH